MSPVGFLRRKEEPLIITITIMKITSITATNFKGSSFTHPLGAITIFHGENGAGKSAVIEALRLGMLGYDPRIPKKKPEMFRAFASGSPMNVQVEFDNGKFNEIELIDKKVAVTGEIAINEEFPDFLLDLSDYWKKSKADKAQFLMSMCVTAQNSTVLKDLESNISKLEQSISGDMSRKKQLEQGIAAKVSADMEVTIQEPPKDLAQQIEQLKVQSLEANGHLRNFSSERSALVEAERSMEALKRAQVKAMREATEPTCEHCGNTVQFLKHLAHTSYQEPMAEAFTRMSCMRPMADIHASEQEWLTYQTQLQAQICVLETQQQNWIRHCGSRSEDEKMQAELDLIGPRLVKNRELLKDAVDSRKKLLSESVAPLLTKANAFLKPTLEMELVIEEGEIGFSAGRFIPFVSLSGAQEVMAIAGLQLAMAQDSKCKLVVMDELGKLHEKTKQRLVVVLETMLKDGTLEQFVGCDVSSKCYGKLSKKCFVEVSRA